MPRKKISKEEIIEDFQRIQNKHGISKMTQSKYDEYGKYSTSTIRLRFGSWNNAVESSGLEHGSTGSEGISKEEILEEINKVDEETEGRPRQIDYKEISKYSMSVIEDRWRSWSSVVEMLGYEPYDPSSDATEDKVIEDIQNVAEKINTSPTIKQYREQGEYSVSAAERIFGSWNNALRSAGFDKNTSHHDT